eukprot:364802-Chlamydomonas_euryale.AAC.8
MQEQPGLLSTRLDGQPGRPSPTVSAWQSGLLLWSWSFCLVSGWHASLCGEHLEASYATAVECFYRRRAGGSVNLFEHSSVQTSLYAMLLTWRVKN